MDHFSLSLPSFHRSEEPNKKTFTEKIKTFVRMDA